MVPLDAVVMLRPAITRQAEHGDFNFHSCGVSIVENFFEQILLEEVDTATAGNAISTLSKIAVYKDFALISIRACMKIRTTIE